MIGIVVITHGGFSQELVKTSELIIGKQEKVAVYGLNHGDDVGELLKKVGDAIQEMDDGSGVLVLTDLFGGSPSNVTAANMKRYKFESITGVNLPMLIEALNSRECCELSELVNLCIDAGINGIKNLRTMILEKV
ncbi:PTS sugar transporter subunit IIA [Petroclostridium sp. X23]|uniref:PTS sugar transporter subunit IIA n=1 Tax=Petroclostridium sp. X23 TaxID=3045146 RepID=UPI0024ADFEB5|nr:PTS sugar transporter subunit IIA [Petroclostridium sp. X23]WHH60517.1 PTS sugar transporter subunit IIA [Petroclostridium sp. X23]